MLVGASVACRDGGSMDGTSTGDDTGAVVATGSSEVGESGGTSAGSSGGATTGGTSAGGSIGGSAGTSGGGSTGVDDEADGSSDGGDSPCSEQSIAIEIVAPNVVLVLGRSGSMVTTWDADGDPGTPAVTRWSSLHRALEAVVDKYPVALGTKLFPGAGATDSDDVGACVLVPGVEVPVTTMNAAAVLAGIPGADEASLAGASPATAAVATAAQHLEELDPAAPRALVLVTDGAANCGAEGMGPALLEAYDEEVHAVVAEAWSVRGIPTHVVGIAVSAAASPEIADGMPDGVVLADRLDQLAIDGGRPLAGPGRQFHAADDEVALTEALAGVLFATLGCVLPLPNEPAFPDDVEVTIAGANVPRVDACDGASGWRFAAPLGPYLEIEVCGEACHDLKFAGEAEVRFYCSAG